MHVYRTHFRQYTIATIAALALTLGIAGCKSTQPAAPAVDDATLSAALQSRIAGDSALSTESIQSAVQDGVATLTGNVSSEAARSLAAADAAQIAGIRTVVNNLSVQSAQQPAPAVAAVTPSPAPMPRVAPKRPAKVTTPKPEPAPAAVPIERQPPTPVAQEQPPTPPVPVTPPPPPPPTFRDVTIPSGTTIPVRITQTLDSATTQQGQSFSGTIATDVMVDGLVAIRQGTNVTGRVSAVQEAAHYKGNSLLTVELVSINRRGESLAVTSDPYSVQGKGRGANTAAKVGGGAAVGAILGGLIGGGKGAAIGAASGGGLGAGANTITRGQQVQIPSESLINFKLTNTLAIRVPTSNTLSTQETQRRPMNSTPEQPQ
jgi:hypothetical protein